MAAPRHRRRRFDDDTWEPSPAPRPTLAADRTDSPRDDDDDPNEPVWSSYRDANRGPTPVPTWVVTDPRAVDVDHGVLKTGKEADVSLVERAVPALDGEPPQRVLMAVKRYRSAEHRMFHRDAAYLEGRRVRRSREMRAMATRTAFGRELIAGQWASAEFVTLSRLWQRGVSVPYPVQLIGTELMMEFVGAADGVAAPRLAQLRPDRAEATELHRQLVDALVQLVEAGCAHGDLSAYNVLVDDGRVVLIDLPQAVDIVGNPQGFAFLRRDCENISAWFAGHGVAHAFADDLFDRLCRAMPGSC